MSADLEVAAGYLAAAAAIRSALAWATDGGPRMAETYEGGAHRDQMLADLEGVKADPLGCHYGRDAAGSVNPPTCWPAGEDWDPADTVAGNLVKALALIEAALQQEQPKATISASGVLGHTLTKPFDDPRLADMSKVEAQVYVPAGLWVTMTPGAAKLPGAAQRTLWESPWKAP